MCRADPPPSPTPTPSAIERIYGDQTGPQICDLLRKNPPVAIPVIVARLEQKDAEWREVRAGDWAAPRRRAAASEPVMLRRCLGSALAASPTPPPPPTHPPPPPKGARGDEHGVAQGL
jgi:hypothetical protein